MHFRIWKRYKINIFWGWMLVLPLGVLGQPNRAFTHLTIAQGLSHNTVYSLLEDQMGQIWAGTRYGLNRFDGYAWKVFLPQEGDSNSLKAFRVHCLWENPEGDIWIGHLNAGISVFERKTERFKRISFSGEGLPDMNQIGVRSIFQDKSGQIWLGTNGNGAWVFDKNYQLVHHFASFKQNPSHRLTNSFVFDFTEDEEGRIWIATGGPGINYYDPSIDQVIRLESGLAGLMDGFGRSLCQDTARAVLWIGTAGKGLFELDLKSLEITKHYDESNSSLSHDLITDLLIEKKGTLYIATDGGGISIFHPAQDQWEQFGYSPQQPGTINSDAIYTLLKDHEQNVWVGTFNGGVNLLPYQSSVFALNPNLVSERQAGLKSVLAICEDGQDRIWLGTDGSGIYMGKPAQISSPFPYELEKVSFPDLAVTSLAFQAPNLLWIGTYEEGLFRFDISTGQYLQMKTSPGDVNSIAYNNVWDIAIDSRGGVWVAILGGGVDYLAPGQSKFVHLEGLSSNTVIGLELDEANGNLWVATEDAGLNKVELKTRTVTHYRHDKTDSNSLSGDKLRCLYLDPAGNLWIGTEYAGLNQLERETETFSRYKTDEGLPSLMIHAILEGAEGNLWLSTQAGIVRRDRSSGNFWTLGSAPYAPTSQFNPNACLALGNGHLIFGNTQGYSLIRPTLLPTPIPGPAVLFTDLRISGQSIPIGTFQDRIIRNGPLNERGTQLSLSYQDKGLQLALATDALVMAEEIRYAYRLTPFESAWADLPAGDRTITYSALPGGSYQLEVKARGQSGTWGKVRTLPIIVAPPFWKSWWFLMATIIGISLAILGSVWLLMARQEARFQRQALRNEQEILRLQNENLEKDVANQRSRLNASLLQVAHKNELLIELKARIQDLKTENATAARSLLREINQELKQEDYWKQFQLAFDQTHTHFLTQLQSLHPELSDHEKRLCCFIRMQLTNREIAAILNITIRGVEQAKYRMKKKLTLSKEQDLAAYIRSIEV